MIKDILLVDDDVDFRELITYMLNAEGYNIDSAISGNDALKYIKSKKYDLILSDINMPDGDSLYFLEEYKKIYSTIPPFFVFVTGFSHLAQEDYLKRGAVLIIQKPFKFHALLEEIDKIEKSL